MESKQDRINLVISENPGWDENTFLAFEKEAEFLCAKTVNLVQAFQSRINVKMIPDSDLMTLKAYLDNYKLVIDGEIARRG